MEYFPFIIIAVIALIVILGAFAAYRNEKKRSQQIAAMANELGLPYFANPDPSVLHDLADFQLFSKGRGRTITNMLHGEADGVQLAIFDYRYTVGSGKSSQTHTQSVVYIRVDDLQTPNFTLGPEHVFHRIGKFLGMQDINFDNYPGFSKKFLLRGPSEKLIREFFNPTRIAFLEQRDRISVECRPGRMAVFYAGIRSEPEKLPELMEVGFQAYRLFRENPAA